MTVSFRNRLDFLVQNLDRNPSVHDTVMSSSKLPCGCSFIYFFIEFNTLCKLNWHTHQNEVNKRNTN